MLILATIALIFTLRADIFKVTNAAVTIIPDVGQKAKVF